MKKNTEGCMRRLINSSLTTKYLEREILSSVEAADYLRISVGTLMNETSNGKIPHYKFGRRNRYLKSELTKLLMSQPKGERHGD